jgi:cytochrome c2
MRKRSIRRDFVTSLMVIWCVQSAEPIRPAAAENQEASANQKDQLALAAKGCEIVGRKNCIQCHSIDGAGGWIAPPFSGIKNHRSEQFIFDRISKSRSAIAEFHGMSVAKFELLKHPRLSDADSTQVVAYLMTLPEPSEGYRVVRHIPLSPQDRQIILERIKPPSGKKDTREGKKLYSDHGCSACHSIGKLGGQFAPALDGIGDRKTAEAIADKINSAELTVKDSKGADIDVKMPPNSLSLPEIKAITRFLLSVPPLDKEKADPGSK